MSIRNKVALLGALTVLKQNTFNDRTKGICAHVYDMTGFGRSVLEPYYKNWLHYSGDPEYPVPHPHKTPKDGFFDTTNMWSSSEYGLTRKDLVNHIINQLKLELCNVSFVTGKSYTSVDASGNKTGNVTVSDKTDDKNDGRVSFNHF